MFKILKKGCEPTKGSKYSAAIDLYSAEDMVIGAGETVKVPLGVCIDKEKLKYYIFDIDQDGTIFDKDPNVDFSLSEIESDKILDNFLKSHYLQLEPRSSLRAKGLIAGTGIIDLDYKDEIMIIIFNPFKNTDLTIKGDMSIEFEPDNTYGGYKISKGDKIAQILLKEHKTYLMGVDTEDERVGGLGSTGK